MAEKQYAEYSDLLESGPIELQEEATETDHVEDESTQEPAAEVDPEKETVEEEQAEQEPEPEHEQEDGDPDSDVLESLRAKLERAEAEKDTADKRYRDLQSFKDQQLSEMQRRMDEMAKRIDLSRPEQPEAEPQLPTDLDPEIVEAIRMIAKQELSGVKALDPDELPAKIEAFVQQKREEREAAEKAQQEAVESQTWAIWGYEMDRIKADPRFTPDIQQAIAVEAEKQGFAEAAANGDHGFMRKIADQVFAAHTKAKPTVTKQEKQTAAATGKGGRSTPEPEPVNVLDEI